MTVLPTLPGEASTAGADGRGDADIAEEAVAATGDGMSAGPLIAARTALKMPPVRSNYVDVASHCMLGVYKKEIGRAHV